MCRGTATEIQAKSMEPQTIQEDISRQAESGNFPEETQVWQSATCQDLQPVMVAPDGYAIHGMCYMNGYQPTSWVTADGVNFVPAVFDTRLQPQACVQPDQAIFQEPPSHGGLIGHVWRLSRDAKGCRQVQQAFEDASSDQERTDLKSELVGHVWEALKCPHANHVIQKCISTMRPLDAQFIIDELRHGALGGVAQAARHRYGCRIMQRLLEHCGVDQVALMVSDLMADAVALSSHIYGNYVMQHILEFCSPEVVSQLTCILEQQLLFVDADGNAGAVIGKALSLTNNERRFALALALVRQPEQLATMSCSRRGQPGVKEALLLVEGSARSEAIAELASRFERLRSCRYGRAVANFVTELQKSC